MTADRPETVVQINRLTRRRDAARRRADRVVRSAAPGEPYQLLADRDDEASSQQDLALQVAITLLLLALVIGVIVGGVIHPQALP